MLNRQCVKQPLGFEGFQSQCQSTFQTNLLTAQSSNMTQIPETGVKLGTSGSFEHITPPCAAICGTVQELRYISCCLRCASVNTTKLQRETDHPSQHWTTHYTNTTSQRSISTLHTMENISSSSTAPTLSLPGEVSILKGSLDKRQPTPTFSSL